MKKFVIQTVLLLAVIAVALFLYKQGDSITLPLVPEKPVFKQLEVNGAKLKVEIADTQSKRSKGLGGRQSLAQDEGMLFIFPKSDKYPFWMKGLTYSLDFVWINADKVVDLLPDIPPPAPGQADTSLPIYESRENVDKVLEAPAGTIQRLNIKVGDTIKIE